jgi:FtsH-binding integral membrane protein
MRRVYEASVSPKSLGAVHAGLRAYLQRVYTYMAMGIGLTAFVSFALASNPPLYIALFQSPLMWFFSLAPLGIALFFGFSIHKMSLSTARGLFWLYASLLGVSLTMILLVYTGESVARLFLVTACTFSGMSLYGYTTQKDLSSLGSFCIMGLLGVLLASLVNLIFPSSSLQFALSIVTVLVFTGLTAYDTQKIRDAYDETLPSDVQGKMAVYGALMLYLDFINIFVALMRLFGDRR